MFTAVKMKNDRVHDLNYFQVRDNASRHALLTLQFTFEFSKFLSFENNRQQQQSKSVAEANLNTSEFHAMEIPMKLILHWFSFQGQTEIIS